MYRSQAAGDPGCRTPGTPLAGALHDAYNYFKNTVFMQTDDPSINCRDYKIIFVTDGIDSADADPCIGGTSPKGGPSGDLGDILLPSTPCAQSMASA